ncbi:hypothetical protein, partial [Amycolatopsis sp.]|uniref:hypothetical protein n=1 Tax=Amycolatopsis sp. TaxID=37632 RepID=UPI002E05FCB9|nr:hypothetical protein [Amycolatopsis sp.]
MSPRIRRAFKRSAAIAATLMVAAGLTVAGAPAAVADDRASFNLTYGGAYYRGTVEFYNRSVLVTGELRGLGTKGCRVGKATAIRNASGGILDVGTTSAVCNGPVTREIPLTADVAGGAGLVLVALTLTGGEPILAHCY